VAAVSPIESITVEVMLKLAKMSPNALKHHPGEGDWDGINRNWVADILYTDESAKFEKIIKDPGML
jgi:hypothetical protein